MNAEPDLSVVLPVKDAAPFIGDTLTSLRRNSEPGFEFIVVDDGSTDGTTEIIDEFRTALPSMRVVRHDRAVGLADARNVGLDAARGRNVTYLDGDDWIAAGYLRRLVEAIDGLACDFVRVDHVQVEERTRTTHRAPEARRNVVLDPRSGVLPITRRTMVDYPYAWAGVYRRRLGDLLHFPGHLHTAEDRPWIWRLHREATSYAVVSLAGLFYRRQVSGSLTQIGDERQLHFLDAFALVLDQVAGEPALQAKAVRQFLAVLAHQMSLGRRMTPTARQQLIERARAILLTLPAQVLLDSAPNDARVKVLRAVMPEGVRLVRSWAS